MSRASQSLFPHHKLDWTISRLRERVEATPDDPAARIQLASAMVSRGLYHGGGERVCNDALAHVRKALADDPANVDGLVVAALALCGMDRPRAASRYLDQAVRVDGELPLLRLAMGKMEGLRGEHGAAVRQLETACRLAPEAWETHLELGRALMVTDFVAAEAAFARSVALKPAADAWLNLARLRLRLGDWAGCGAALSHLPQTAETRAMAYRVACETGAETAALRADLLSRASERPEALTALTRTAKGHLPLRLPQAR